MPPATAPPGGLHLTPREWILVAAASAVFVLGLPAVWDGITPDSAVSSAPVSDRRLPYALSEDYWSIARFAARAATEAEVICLGDSVIWGAYAACNETLSHFLQARDGRRFANLGFNGAHPAALDGVLRHHGAAIAGKIVVLHCNLLWLSSPRQDLSDAKEARFNHQRIVPQLDASISVYRADLSTRIGVTIEQRVPFLQLARHLQQAAFDQVDFSSWTLENPYRVPLFGPWPADQGPAHTPVAWSERGLEQQSFEWVDLRRSVQWRFFRSTVERLRSRNRVVVLLGPFNEHMLKEDGRARYEALRAGIVQWLDANGILTLAPAALPSALYADASHPLAEGYRRLALGIDVPR